jgi:hypothetical protein
MSAFSTKFKTTWVLVVVAVALAAWDLYARKTPEGTISEVILSSARHSPLLPFLFGVLMGHLFWFQEVPKK